jgi:hypothetical protein
VNFRVIPACVQRIQHIGLLGHGQPCHLIQQTLQFCCLRSPLHLPSTWGSRANFDGRVSHGVRLSLTNAQRADSRPSPPALPWICRRLAA